ncbi:MULTISPECIES: hypothetical protein [Paraburkholderia]|uniref:hypothetical protein n=1 Tax=Paraburkholderia TaxID=1822464 RepID=UPI00225B8067|nr:MULTISPECIES: hypothetical protein [Paraburkholderia]MCX4160917.1 hypothetical protein [Paraburkholderia megapolitana]MDN7156413.1 hypothetical protein [Paraburkholderia sp. CHISQ3]MDQ6493458.1 hypothetical protein [Paraburkholderia megapolitana]
MYNHDLERHSSFFAVQRGCGRINAILDAKTFDVTIANHTENVVTGGVEMRVYYLDSSLAGKVTQNIGNVVQASRRTSAIQSR